MMNFDVAKQIMNSFADKSDCATDMFGKIFRAKQIVKELLGNADKYGLDSEEREQFQEDLSIFAVLEMKLPDGGLFYEAQMAIFKGVSAYVDEMLCDPEFKELYDTRLSAEIRFMENAD